MTFLAFTPTLRSTLSCYNFLFLLFPLWTACGSSFSRPCCCEAPQEQPFVSPRATITPTLLDTALWGGGDVFQRSLAPYLTDMELLHLLLSSKKLYQSFSSSRQLLPRYQALSLYKNCQLLFPQDVICPENRLKWYTDTHQFVRIGLEAYLHQLAPSLLPPAIASTYVPALPVYHPVQLHTVPQPKKYLHPVFYLPPVPEKTFPSIQERQAFLGKAMTFQQAFQQLFTPSIQEGQFNYHTPLLQQPSLTVQTGLAFLQQLLQYRGNLVKLPVRQQLILQHILFWLDQQCSTLTPQHRRQCMGLAYHEYRENLRKLRYTIDAIYHLMTHCLPQQGGYPVSLHAVVPYIFTAKNSQVAKKRAAQFVKWL